MAIKVTKPAVNVIEKLNELKQHTGVKGQELMRADTVAEAREALAVGRKNLIINGDMQITQRGTGATTGGTYMTADRWKAGTAAETFQVVTNDRDLSIPNMMKVTSTSSGYGTFIQPIEGVQHTSGQNITLSFWAKTSNFSNMRLEIQQNFGSGGSATVTPINNASYFTVPDTGWNKYTATIEIASISGKTVGTGSHLNILFGPNSGTNAGVTYYSEVQVELGSVATEFEHRSYGEELALCQRYYQKSYDKGIYAGSTSSAGAQDMYGSSDGTNVLSKIYYPVHTRTNSPTITIYNTNNSTAGQAYIISASGSANYNVTINNVATSGFRCYVPKNGAVWAAHRLIFQWVVDDEL